MLVTRLCDTDRHSWSPNKFGMYQGSAPPTRMSNFEPLNAQPDWQEQYSSYPPPAESQQQRQQQQHSYQPSHNNNSGGDNHGNQSENQQAETRPSLGHRHSLNPIDLRQEPHAPVTIERPDSAPPGDSGNQNNEPATRHDSLISTTSTSQSITSSQLGVTSNPQVKHETSGLESSMNKLETKSDGEDDVDDDEMLEMDDENDGPHDGPPKTTAERMAERRKMKRFRLSHQQTRFLMSEFAKQAHPDALHRERLSREIPGLSPRQVQVWFQNRRAKIKRLNVDDRERMMKMRAVPDDFDNVQALHSPYGATHGLQGAPLTSPIDYVPAYGDPSMMRPLMLDTLRRHEHDEHMAPGMSPAFGGHVGFAPAGSIGTPDVLSPLSISSNDRYYPQSHLSSPVSSGPRSGNPFASRQSSTDNYHRGPSRPLVPLQLRETMSRSRSETLQSPLRSSMSWKGDNLDYGSYQGSVPSPSIGGRPQHSVYQPEQASSNPTSAHHYDSNAYQNSSTHMSYQPPPSQSSPAALSRFRASSTSAPYAPPASTQYRTLPSQVPQAGQQPHESRSYASAYTTGYSSAPLSAPSDFSLPRTPADLPARDYHVPQLSAPMAPPGDFAAYAQRPASTDRYAPDERYSQDERYAPRESYADEQRHSQSPQYLRGDDFNHKRKRSYTMPGSFGTP